MAYNPRQGVIFVVYTHKRLRLVLDCKSRGGMSSRLTIDSDWEVLGGNEEFKEWREDIW